MESLKKDTAYAMEYQVMPMHSYAPASRNYSPKQLPNIKKKQFYLPYWNKKKM